MERISVRQGQVRGQVGRQFVGLLLELVEFRDEELGEVPAGHVFHLFVGDGGAPSGLVHFHDALEDLGHPGVVLVHRPFPFQFQPGIEPMDDAGLAGFVGDGDPDGPVQDLGRIEGVVDLLVLEEPVGVDAGAGVVEVLPHKGVTGRNVIVQFPLEVLADLADHRGVDAVGGRPGARCTR